MKKTALFLIALLGAAGLLYLLTLQEQGYRRREVSYRVPAISLLNQRGETVELHRLLQSDKPLLLQFIFTSCTSLCPGQSVLFANLQQRLNDPQQLQLVSISVDPETDTPQVLAQYLERFQARPGWQFLTGSKADIQQVMEAFGISPSDMITRDSSLLLRRPDDGQWFRIDGQLTSRDILHEYQRLR